MDEVRFVVVGAGIVGLAVAAELSRGGETALLERHDAFGRETSGRNSEVIHAGLYYPPGSLKAGLCVEGRRLLIDRCRRLGIPHRMTGKLVVAATPEEVAGLEALRATGGANGAEGLRMLDAGALAAMEPAVAGVAALWSPGTGIVDSHALMRSLEREAVARGCLVAYGSEVVRLVPDGDGAVVATGSGDEVRASLVVNAAGLSADRVAAMAGIDPDAAGCRIRPVKGSYFAYAGESPVSRLIYPPPRADHLGLGVHATLDLAGRLRFGPDADEAPPNDLAVDPAKADAFFAGAARLVRGLARERLHPDTAGIRPRLAGDGFRDFVIRREERAGLPWLVTLAGIESPGLTAALAIGREVARLAGLPAA